MKKMPDIYLKDLLRPEWMLRKICRWLDGDVKGNVRLALTVNDIDKGLREYQDQQDHAKRNEFSKSKLRESAAFRN